jgi:protein-tyrosine-phosphatase/carbamoylphosphate synthase large subunit
LRSFFLNTILITNAHERSAQIAIQSLKKAGYKTIVSSSKNSLYLVKYKNEILLHPCPSKETILFENWLKELLRKDNELFVLPINEAVLFACELIRINHPEFAPRFIMPSHNSLQYALSKLYATRAAQKANIKTPKTYFIKEVSAKGLNLPKDDLAYPMILKWDNVLNEDQYHKGSLCIVQNKQELLDTVMELLPFNSNIILQELVPGNGVGAFFFRQKGEILLRFAHKRLHEVPWTGGVSAYCESSADATVLEMGERLLEAMDYEGLAMVEFRKEEGKPPVFLEINGRLWGSSGLAMAAGADFPRAMVEYHLKGQIAVKQPTLKKKVQWHEPRFEMLYLQSLKTNNKKTNEPKPNLVLARANVLSNFINPKVKTDWWIKDELRSSFRSYLGLIKGELAKLKMSTLNKKKTDINPLVQQTSVRSKDFFIKKKAIKNILFVCYGNICRSPYAEFRWQQFLNEYPELPQAKSVGFHDNINRETPARFQSVASHLGVNLVNHRSKRITKALIEEADVLIAMDNRNLIDIQREFPEAMSKTILLGAVGVNKNAEIDDPYGKNMGTGWVIYRRMDEDLNILKNILLK